MWFFIPYRAARTFTRIVLPRRRGCARSSSNVGEVLGFIVVIWGLLSLLGPISHHHQGQPAVVSAAPVTTANTITAVCGILFVLAVIALVSWGIVRWERAARKNDPKPPVILEPPPEPPRPQSYWSNRR